MSTTEDRARAAMRAIAGTVSDAPPLRLKPAPEPEPAPEGIGLPGDDPHHLGAARAGRSRSAGHGRGPRRPGGTVGPSSRAQDRRWRSWLAPITAAAIVVVVAIALVVIKNLPHGSPARKNTATSTVGPGGAPRYYAALEEAAPNQPYGVAVGDSVTGKKLATFAPPTRTEFVNVSAAADDRTFVVLAVTSSATGQLAFTPLNGTTFTASWYEVRLSPGSAHPAQLRRLPIKSWSWTGSPNIAPGTVAATALSASGQELAVADYPDIPAAKKLTGDWHEVRVYSVATGRLLHDWIEDNPAARIEGGIDETMATVPVGTPALTWIDNDQALAFATSFGKTTKITKNGKTSEVSTSIGTIRKLDVAGPTSGNLMTDATVMWTGTLSYNQSNGCFQDIGWPPLLSADGNSISCATWVMPATTPGYVDFDTYPLAAGHQPTLDYQGTILPEDKTGGLTYNVAWVSPSGGTLIVAWGGPGLKTTNGSHFGVISHGKFTPLPLQANRAALLSADITF